MTLSLFYRIEMKPKYEKDFKNKRIDEHRLLYSQKPPQELTWLCQVTFDLPIDHYKEVEFEAVLSYSK